MRTLGKIYLLLLMALIGTASGQEGPALFDNVQIDGEKCNLVETGSHNEKIIWNGEKFGIGMCSIVVNRSEFQKKYSYCALSGALNSTNGGFTCTFGYYDKENTKISFIGFGSATCQFICVKP